MNEQFLKIHLWMLNKKISWWILLFIWCIFTIEQGKVSSLSNNLYILYISNNLCCHCVLEPYNPFSIITLYLFLLLFKFLTHYLFVFNSFHCSCTGFSMYFTFLPVGGTLLFMLSLCIEALLSVCHRCFVSVSVLI